MLVLESRRYFLLIFPEPKVLMYLLLAAPCSMRVRSQFPRSGIEPTPSAVKRQSHNHQSLNHWIARDGPALTYLLFVFSLFFLYWMQRPLLGAKETTVDRKCTVSYPLKELRHEH